MNLNIADIILLLLFIGAFVLGFIGGTIRQLLILVVWLVSFLLAANLAIPTGKFLGSYWSEFSAPYSQMLTFLLLYIGFLIIGNIIVFVMYKRSPMVGRLAFLDELVGGVLAVGVAVLIVGGFIAILDSFYKYQSVAATTEHPIVHSIFQALEGSSIAAWLRDSFVLALGAVLSPLLPADLRPYL
ncbi:MAG: CvpA family protein [Candidatus Limnocylindrales bacterium]